MKFLYHSNAACLAVGLVLLRSDESLAWAPLPVTVRSRSSTSLFISNLFDKEPSLPRDVKEAVTLCRAATQEALKNRCSRVTIDFPVGTKFQVEPTPKTNKQQPPTQEDFRRSDRELARLFVDMFQPVGGENIVVCFNDAESADLAKKKWKGDTTARCTIRSVDRSRTTKKKKKKRGFAAKLAQEMEDDDSGGGPFQLPKNTEVALFVAPTAKELMVIERICNDVGMGTLVILLNGRLSSTTFNSKTAERLFLEEFEPVFHLAALPQDIAPNGLLYRTYPGKWVVARKPAVGAPMSLLSTPQRPTLPQCQDAFDKVAPSGVETALENVAGWFS